MIDIGDNEYMLDPKHCTDTAVYWYRWLYFGNNKKYYHQYFINSNVKILRIVSIQILNPYFRYMMSWSMYPPMIWNSIFVF